MKTKSPNRVMISPSGVVNRVNNRGPRTEILAILTKLNLVVKYDLIKFNAVPVTPKVSENLFIRTA